MSKASKKAHAQVVAQVEGTTVPVEVVASPATTPAKVRYAQRTWQDTWVISNLISNPKRGKSQARFALMFSGQTVAEYCNAVVQNGLGNRTLAQADLRWGTAPQRAQFTIDPPVAS